MKNGMAARLFLLSCRKEVFARSCSYFSRSAASIVSIILYHHNFTTIIGFFWEPVLFSSVIKPSVSEGNVCWKAPITALNCCLELLIVAWSSLRRREGGACRLFWREKWKLARLNALTQICETCLMQENRGGVWDDVDEIKRKLRVWRPLQSDRLSANMRVRVLSPDTDECEGSRRKVIREKGDDCDDSKIRLTLVPLVCA